MRRFFEIVGVLTLIIVSFSYQEEVSKVVKMSDTLMEEIEARAPSYKQEKIEGIILENTIIPGLNGKTVDINSSYNNMKKDGMFDESKLVYERERINNTLDKNTNRYIVSGNKSKKHIALIFKVDKNDDTDKIVNTLKQNEVKASFFVDQDFASNKHDKLKNIISDGNTIGNLEEGNDYIWLKTLVTSGTYQTHNYCITINEDNKRLYFCDKYKDYTIKVPVLIKGSLLYFVKKNNENGKIFYIDINKKTINELSSTINYLLARGYTLESLEMFLEE